MIRHLVLSLLLLAPLAVGAQLKAGVPVAGKDYVVLNPAQPTWGTGGIEVLNILGLSDENFHIGAQHLNALGDSQHPNCAKQGVGPFGSPIHQGQLHLWAHDGNDQTGYSSSAS